MNRNKERNSFPRQRQPGCNSGDGAHRDWFRPSYWHPTSQNRRHQKGAWDCSTALLWRCFFLLLSFLFIWPDFHVIFFHVLWTSFIFSLLLPWGRMEVLGDVCPPANTKKEPQKSSQRLSCTWSLALQRTVGYSNRSGISLRLGLDEMGWRGGRGWLHPSMAASGQSGKVPSWLTKWSCLIPITLLGVLMSPFSDSLFPFFFFPGTEIILFLFQKEEGHSLPWCSHSGGSWLAVEIPFAHPSFGSLLLVQSPTILALSSLLWVTKGYKDSSFPS